MCDGHDHCGCEDHNEEHEHKVLLVDESGQEKEFTIVTVFEVSEKEYAVLVSSDSSEDEEGVILRIDEEDGEEFLVDIEDEEEWDKVLTIYQQLIDEENNE